MDLGGHEGADEDLSSTPMPPSGFMSTNSNSGNGLQERGEKLKVIYPTAGGAVATGAAVPGASNTHISGRIGGGNSSSSKDNTTNNLIINSNSNNHTSNGTVSNGSNGLAGPNTSTNGPRVDEVRIPSSLELKGRKPLKYRECLKNHAASLGGYAIDGCGEFMPSGEEGTLEALRCAACGCHRNFHRREPDGELLPCECRSHYGLGSHSHDRKRIETLFPSPSPYTPLALPPPPLPHAHGGIGVGGGGIGMPPPPPPQMIMAFNPSVGTDSDEFDGGLMSPQSPLKKRFRTKFTLEQKEQMFEFAEKLGWRIQKHDEEAVQQFCMDVGVKRHVLKVWMHNNKHTLGKKLTAAPEEEVEAS